ncbi:hypothetical protein RE476_08310 [Methanolobus mangrovi]|uniref:DUF7343 domain-containing protein n=1 Tax=Methanolobus mangrovi TaxID=3072977 RepID=A0AA51YG03_9EURY|nr:hypothetical protein [Methanolobus mangrovi]WMW21407.1 hypothetical protein RE476_08310 [Methanolobus mangrovi]
MKVISCIGCIAIILLLSGLAGASGIATVHGVAYEWSTFEPLDNAIIEVNSTPAQSMVAKYGVYSFELTNGTYHITASYYEDDQLTYYAEDIITVSDEGSYVLDLLLLPSYSSSDDTASSVTDVETESSSPVANASSLIFGSIFVVIILLVLLAYQMKQRPQRSPALKPIKEDENDDETSHVSHVVTGDAAEMIREEVQDMALEEDREETITEILDEPGITSSVESEREPLNAAPINPDEPVPADLQEILDILKTQGGRMTQKDMRKRLKYSEGKVSLMLLDLEKRGKIQKFKKGRGNVLFLVESDE